jgi:hypothetical protein
MVVFGLIGSGLVKAAVDDRPRSAIGLDRTLNKLLHNADVDAPSASARRRSGASGMKLVPAGIQLIASQSPRRRRGLCPWSMCLLDSRRYWC